MKTAAALAAIFTAATILTSCNKTDLLDTNGLAAGKGSISFTTSSAFGGSTSFGNSTVSVSNVTYTTGSSFDEYFIGVSDNSTSKVRIADISLELPKGTSTDNGAVTAFFGVPAGTNGILPELTINSATGSGSDHESYTAISGSVTITKLSSTEIEGTFSAEARNEEDSTKTITITNGKFKGKP